MEPIILLDRIFAISIPLIFPFLLAFWFFKNYKKSWKIMGIGALSYFVINLFIGLIMLLVSLINPDFPKYFLIVFLGLIPGILAALSEEIIRFFSMKLFLKKHFNWKNAFLFGIGWGGIECIIFGIGKIFELITLNIDPSFTYIFPLGISRIVVVIAQVALSVLMIQVFIQRKPLFFLYALFFHLISNVTLKLLSPLILKTGLIGYSTHIITWFILIALSLYIICKFDEENHFKKILTNSIKNFLNI
jgi:uncharacterized membrane protein YhfC